MPKNFEDVKSAMGRVRGFVSMVQIDAMDGKFVPNRSWPYYAAGEYSNDFLDLIQNEAGAMPFWEELDFEADLMISEPSMNDVDNWIMAGAKRIIIHAGSVKDTDAMAALVAEIRAKYPKTEIGAGTLLELAVAYHVDTPIDYANTFIDQLDFIQCMGIAKVGFQSPECRDDGSRHAIVFVDPLECLLMPLHRRLAGRPGALVVHAAVEADDDKRLVAGG